MLITVFFYIVPGISFGDVIEDNNNGMLRRISDSLSMKLNREVADVDKGDGDGEKNKSDLGLLAEDLSEPCDERVSLSSCDKAQEAECHNDLPGIGPT